MLRSHHGNEEKCTNVLVHEYGLPNNPLSQLTQRNEDGSNRIAFVEQWIAERQNIDSQMELLVQSIKSVGSSTMSAKDFSAITTESMIEQANNMNISINFQSANQRVLNELTSLTTNSKTSLADSDLSMASEMMFSRISRLSSRLSSGSLGRNSFGSLPWMNGDEPMDDSIEGIVNTAIQESQKHTGDENGQNENWFSSFDPGDKNVTNGHDENVNDNGHETMGFIYETAIADRDVKLGRGKPLQRHPGNIWFRNQIRTMFPEYDRAEKSRQTQMSLDMVHFVRNENRRFLAAAPKLKGYWREISVAEAREKVAVNFRTERKRRNKNQFAFGS